MVLISFFMPMGLMKVMSIGPINQNQMELVIHKFYQETISDKERLK